MNAESSASAWVKLLLNLVARIVEAVGKRDFKRVERILPQHLRTTLERQLADDEAEQRFARREDATAPSIRLDPERNGAGQE